MSRIRWFVVVFALLGMALASPAAGARVAFDPSVSAHHDGLAPIVPPTGSVSALTRNQRQPLSKLLAAVALLIVAVTTRLPAVSRRRRTNAVVDLVATAVRRRGPPQHCFSASI